MSNDIFSKLRAEERCGTPPDLNVRNWSYEIDGNVMGEIKGFSSFDHPQYGEQHTIIVSLADTGELISAFINSAWLQEGLKRQRAEIGDLILIRYFGKVRPTDHFNTYTLHIEKARKSLVPMSTHASCANH